jgi:hypothetical protein
MIAQSVGQSAMAKLHRVMRRRLNMTTVCGGSRFRKAKADVRRQD